jgi:hypothetical protein
MKIKFEIPFFRKNIVFLLRLLIALFFSMSIGLTLFLLSNNVSNEVMWKGTVHYHEEYKKLYQWKGQNRHCSVDAKSNWHTTTDVFLIVSFEGREGGSAGDPKIRANHNSHISTECQWKRDHEICAGKVEINAASWEDRQKGTRKVSPGHTGKMTTALETKGYKGEASLDLYADEETGTFTLFGEGEIKAPQPVFKSEKVFHDACSGEMDRKTENQTFPDTGAMWFFNVQGKFSGNTISGTKILEDVKAIPEGERDSPTCNEHMSCSFSPLQAAPIEYLSKKSVTWNFRRVGEDDCLGIVTLIQGDVRINGKRSEIGPVPLSGGSNIDTGPTGRIMIVFPEQGVEYRFGSNTSLKLPDPCHKENTPPDRLIEGLIYSILSKVEGGSGEPPKFSPGNCPGGIRGTPIPILERGGHSLLLAPLMIPNFLYPVAEQVDNQTQEVEEMAPNDVEMEEVETVFMVERIPDNYLQIKAVKGSVKLSDSSGRERILEPGQTFWRSLKPGEEAGPMKEIFIVADKK